MTVLVVILILLSCYVGRAELEQGIKTGYFVVLSIFIVLFVVLSLI